MVLAQVIGIGIGDAIMRPEFTAPPCSYADTVEDSLQHAILAVLAMDILAVEVQPTGIANSQFGATSAALHRNCSTRRRTSVQARLRCGLVAYRPPMLPTT